MEFVPRHPLVGDGWRALYYCPDCGSLASYRHKSRKIFSCQACGRQFSVTSGTIFAGRKMAIRDLLVAIAIFVNGAKGHSALQLSRDLDCQYKTAFVLAHKLREALGAETKQPHPPLIFVIISVISDGEMKSEELIMSASQVKFDSFDEPTRSQAIAALKVLDADDGHDVKLLVGSGLAQILRRFVQVALDAGGVAYGPLSSDLSPEQAGKILGISRPLVVQRMEDGRLLFHYVGAHRRCSLKDVLELKVVEDKQNQIMHQLYDELDALEPDHKP